jgi:hypothetical protein
MGADACLTDKTLGFTKLPPMHSLCVMDGVVLENNRRLAQERYLHSILTLHNVPIYHHRIQTPRHHGRTGCTHRKTSSTETQDQQLPAGLICETTLRDGNRHKLPIDYGTTVDPWQLWAVYRSAALAEPSAPRPPWAPMWTAQDGSADKQRRIAASH